MPSELLLGYCAGASSKIGAFVQVFCGGRFKTSSVTSV